MIFGVSTWIAEVSGIVIGLSVILGGIVKVSKWMSSQKKWMDEQRELWDKILAEFAPNGGSSMKDGMNRLEATMNASLRMSGKPFWRSDHHGVATYISPVLAQVMGGSQEQFINNGWIGAVPESDRHRVVDSWMKSIQDHREFDCRYSYEHPDGTLVPVHGYAIPLLVESPGERRVIGYLGWVEVL